MATGFNRQVRDFASKTKRQMLQVQREAAQEIFTEAQTPVSAGGSMPVKKGFLRGSFTIGLSKEPAVITTTRSGDAWREELAPLKLGQTIRARWTAPYAVYMDYRYGFARKARQRWPAAVAKAKARIFGNGR